MLKNKRIGLFITGGIAAYKMPELTRQLIKKGAEVRVSMTKAACEFVTPLTMQVVSRNNVFVDTFDEKNPQHVQHIEFADWMDLAVVVPATANTIAKITNGIGDDAVTSTLLATNVPRLIVPAMNTKMYENPATTRNLKQAALDGWTVMEPDTGFLAEGYSGKGRLPELEKIVEEIELLAAKSQLDQLLKDKKVVISAAGTRERIDPVRYITNDSSGKMGLALAKTATWYGADEVVLVSANPTLSVPSGVKVVNVDSAREMLGAMESEFSDSDYVIMAAAVSDYRVKQVASQKIKKTAEPELTIDLVENPDILKTLGSKKENQILVGFAAETNDLIENAQKKLVKKNADWIIANDVSRRDIGFNVDENQVTIIGRSGQHIQLDKLSKIDTALEIWKNISGEVN